MENQITELQNKINSLELLNSQLEEEIEKYRKENVNEDFREMFDHIVHFYDHLSNLKIESEFLQVLKEILDCFIEIPNDKERILQTLQYTDDFVSQASVNNENILSEYCIRGINLIDQNQELIQQIFQKMFEFDESIRKLEDKIQFFISSSFIRPTNQQSILKTNKQHSRIPLAPINKQNKIEFESRIQIPTTPPNIKPPPRRKNQ
jgi:hypothetical protein